ncbi:MAG TPA: hypothetical protein VGM31_11120 [Puia sp.]|jgi:putative ABC transport system permease protein
MFVAARERGTFDWSGFTTSGTKYLLLKPGADVAAFSKKMAPFYAKYHFPKNIGLYFQPVPSIHLYSNVENEPFANSSIRNVYIFAVIAVLILLIGCINYINLTTARSFQRLREVGVRKVLGAILYIVEFILIEQ